MKKIYLAITVLCFSLASHAQIIDTSGLTVNKAQLDSVKVTSDLVGHTNDSISRLQKSYTDLVATNQSLLAEKLKLLNEKKSIQNITQKITNNLKELEENDLLLSTQKTLLTKQVTELKKQISALNDTVTEKNKKIVYNDSVIDVKTKQNNKIDSSIKKSDSTLQQRQASISKQLDSLEVIAKIDMIDNTVKIYHWTNTYDKNELKSYEKHYRVDVLHDDHPPIDTIQQINITVKEGMILEVIARTNRGIYRNRRSIVDLLHLGEYKKTMILFHEHQAYDPKIESTCIFLDDLVRYTPIRSYYDVAYGDFDITLTPTNDGRYYLIRESTSINTYFNIAAFTDIKGISGEPNGLAQFTAEAKFITNTRSFGTTAIVPFNYVAFRGGLAKFDSDFKGAELKNNDSISRKDLLQRANYSLGVKVNLFKWFLSPKPLFLYDKVELNAGYNFLGTKVFDTSFKDAARTVVDTTTKSVTQNQWYIEPVISFSRHRNFSMSLALPLYFNNVKHNAVTDFGIKNISTEVWAAPGISLMYFGKRDTGSKLFFRYNNYINLKNKTQSFTQMQLGYSINLTEVWSGSGSK